MYDYTYTHDLNKNTVVVKMEARRFYSHNMCSCC